MIYPGEEEHIGQHGDGHDDVLADLSHPREEVAAPVERPHEPDNFVVFQLQFRRDSGVQGRFRGAGPYAPEGPEVQEELRPEVVKITPCAAVNIGSPCEGDQEGVDTVGEVAEIGLSRPGGRLGDMVSAMDGGEASRVGEMGSDGRGSAEPCQGHWGGPK